MIVETKMTLQITWSTTTTADGPARVRSRH